MKTLVMIGQTQETLEEVKSLIGGDWIIWGIDGPEQSREILTSLPAEVGIVDLNAFGPKESWVEKVRSLPTICPWIGILPADIPADEAARLAPFLVDILYRPLSTPQLQWTLQKGRDERGRYRGSSQHSEVWKEVPRLPFSTPERTGVSPAGSRGKELLFSRPMTAGFDLERLLNFFLDAVVEAAAVHRVSLLLLDEESRAYRIFAFRGFIADVVKPLRLAPKDGIPTWMARHGRILKKDQVWADPYDPLREEISREMEILGCAVSIPVVDQGRLVGMLNLGEKMTGAPYTDAELQDLFFLSGHVAESMSGIRRYRRLVKDLSDLPGREKDERRAGTSRTLDELVGGIAHELRNPLVAVSTFTQLLKDRYEDPELREFFYNTVSGEVDRLNQLVERLTTFAQPIPYRFETEDIRFLIEESLSRVHVSIQDRGIKVIQDLSGGTGPVHADRSQCVKAMAGIIRHAVRSMPAGGVLAIRTVTHPGFVEILVHHRGPGIPAEDLKRIFDPIHAAAQGEEGIGLLLSRKIVEDHRGSLRVDSGLHQETTYTVTLPQIEAIQGGRHVGEKERSGCR